MTRQEMELVEAALTMEDAWKMLEGLQILHSPFLESQEEKQMLFKQVTRPVANKIIAQFPAMSVEDHLKFLDFMVFRCMEYYQRELPRIKRK